MKKELPPAAIAAVVVFAVLVLVGVWALSGGTGQMSADEKKLAEKQLKVQEDHANINLGGSGGGGSDPGSSAPLGEAEARLRGNK